MKYSKDEVQQARDRLLALLKPGDEVLCVLRNAARSGMSREIDLQFHDGETYHWLSRSVAVLLGRSMGKFEGIRIGGCGMDMGLALVYELGRALWPEGFRCAGEKCGANDHSNPPFPRRRKGKMTHRNSGYSLKHRWM
jgi:hypothetical protein